MSGHLLFLSSFFGGDWEKVQGIGDFFGKVLFPTGLWIPFTALFLSHGFSFLKNFLEGAGEPEGPGLWSLLRKSLEVQKRTVELQKQGKTLPPDDPGFLEVQRSGKGFSGQFQHLMADPYQRIVVMHLTIIFGGILTMILPWKEAAYFLLVLLKMGADTAAHARKNFKAAPREDAR
jgi:hypothetical protein